MGHSVRGMRMGSSSGGGGGTSGGDKPEVPGSVRSERNDSRDAVERRKKKKAQYLQLKKMEMDKEAELAAKYRDRAKERREVSEKEDGGEGKESELRLCAARSCARLSVTACVCVRALVFVHILKLYTDSNL